MLAVGFTKAEIKQVKGCQGVCSLKCLQIISVLGPPRIATFRLRFVCSPCSGLDKIPYKRRAEWYFTHTHTRTHTHTHKHTHTHTRKHTHTRTHTHTLHVFLRVDQEQSTQLKELTLSAVNMRNAFPRFLQNFTSVSIQTVATVFSVVKCTFHTVERETQCKMAHGSRNLVFRHSSSSDTKTQRPPRRNRALCNLVRTRDGGV